MRSGMGALMLGGGLLAREIWRRSHEAGLHGRVALVSGGSRGLGFLLARELLQLGCRVAICGRNVGSLERARQELSGLGDVLAVACDVGDRSQVRLMVRHVMASLGPIDLLINNAGIIQVGPQQSMTIEDFEQAQRVIFFGTVNPTLAVLPEMRARRSGRIANITSIGGRVSIPHLLPYSCAKFSTVAFSEGLRSELTGSGVSVTTVVPGLMRTGSHENAAFKGRHAAEMTWFSLAASLPGLSMDAERAARQIIRGIRRGDASVTLTLPALVLDRMHGLMPGTMANLLGIVNGLLPRGANPEAKSGSEVRDDIHMPLFEQLTGFGRSAAERFNEKSERRAA
jgi:NAD(P)-dependent dehydrogenase (short-subunit alcohol dehydrogenase family)